MKERLVEDWLTRINERGYQTAFGQILLSRGFRVLRIGHSPYEHGKDVLAVSSEGEVHCYQLKDGDIGIKEWERDYGQTCALVETRPRHPALPNNYLYRPFIVTNGEFTDPVIDRIDKHNDAWEARGHPRINRINGKDLHRDLVQLSADFWPVEPPDVRAFRSLYLTDGRGDFVPEEFARFMRTLLAGDLPPKELDRRAAAANVFASYLLGEFHRQTDYWNVFRGWVLCAAYISWAAERHSCGAGSWRDSFALAKQAAMTALGALAGECKEQTAFVPKQLELDEYTCLRNTVAVGAWATFSLLEEKVSTTPSQWKDCVDLVERFLTDGCFWFWGEGALPTLLSIVWLLENEGKTEAGLNLLLSFAKHLVVSQRPDSHEPLPDPYVSPEEALKRALKNRLPQDEKRPTAIQSYALFPLTLLLVRRGLRKELEAIWRELSYVRITFFAPEHSWDYLEWHCSEGTERDVFFEQPQSWAKLVDIANSPPIDRLPEVLRKDRQFALMFLLAVPHRQTWSIVGSLDRALHKTR